LAAPFFRDSRPFHILALNFLVLQGSVATSLTCGGRAAILCELCWIFCYLFSSEWVL